MIRYKANLCTYITWTASGKLWRKPLLFQKTPSKLSSWFSAMRLLVETETTFASVNIISAFVHETLFIPDEVILSSHDNLSSRNWPPPLYKAFEMSHTYVACSGRHFPCGHIINTASSSNISEHSFLAFMWKGITFPSPWHWAAKLSPSSCPQFLSAFSLSSCWLQPSTRHTHELGWDFYEWKSGLIIDHVMTPSTCLISLKEYECIINFVLLLLIQACVDVDNEVQKQKRNRIQYTYIGWVKFFTEHMQSWECPCRPQVSNCPYIVFDTSVPSLNFFSQNTLMSIQDRLKPSIHSNINATLLHTTMLHATCCMQLVAWNRRLSVQCNTLQHVVSCCL